jgi:hypothetical protein
VQARDDSAPALAEREPVPRSRGKGADPPSFASPALEGQQPSGASAAGLAPSTVPDARPASGASPDDALPDGESAVSTSADRAAHRPIERPDAASRRVPQPAPMSARTPAASGTAPVSRVETDATDASPGLPPLEPRATPARADGEVAPPGSSSAGKVEPDRSADTGLAAAADEEKDDAKGPRGLFERLAGRDPAGAFAPPEPMDGARDPRGGTDSDR